MKYSVTRQIEFDAGHRVQTHGSKCVNKHGHRYKVIICCSSANLIESGIQSGMVADFGLLKGIMTQHIADHFDHSFIVSIKDELLINQFYHTDLNRKTNLEDWFKTDKEQHTVVIDRDDIDNKLCVIREIPTAENLAILWFNMLKPKMPKYIDLEYIQVYETPNCMAQYPYA